MKGTTKRKWNDNLQPNAGGPTLETPGPAVRGPVKPSFYSRLITARELKRKYYITRGEEVMDAVRPLDVNKRAPCSVHLNWHSSRYSHLWTVGTSFHPLLKIIPHTLTPPSTKHTLKMAAFHSNQFIVSQSARTEPLLKLNYNQMITSKYPLIGSNGGQLVVICAPSEIQRNAETNKDSKNKNRRKKFNTRILYTSSWRREGK